jgi:AraC-like DNA-binding protein
VADAWSLERRAPAAVLAPYVAWYWSVCWDLRGRPAHRQVTLPHASAHLVVEDGGALLHGPPRRHFARLLAGRGWVVGVRFTAGGLAALLGAPLRGGPVPAGAVPGLDGERLAGAVTAATDLDAAAALLDAALAAVVPAVVDPALETVERAVSTIERDGGVLRVTDLADRLGLGVRVLQRLFADRVGVGPGWVIRRCRLQEAARYAVRGGDVDWGRLAADLGYCDQAHLVRDFTATVGAPPARYARG